MVLQPHQCKIYNGIDKYDIIADNAYVGKTFICTCYYDSNQVQGTWAITSGGTYASINSNGKVTINEGVIEKSIYDFTITYDPNTLLSNYTLIVRDNIGETNVVKTYNIFEVNELDFLIGYGLNQQGEPYRYSNVQIYDFTISQIKA